TDPVPWRSVDPASTGPASSMLLMWPMLLGGDITISTARMTAVALMAGTWFCVYLALAGVDRSVRILISGCLLLFLAATKARLDFLDYGTEQLAVFLIALAALLTLSSRHLRLPHPLLFANGLVLGLIPFAKPQAIPIAATILSIQVVVAFVCCSRWST